MLLGVRCPWEGLKEYILWGILTRSSLFDASVTFSNPRRIPSPIMMTARPVCPPPRASYPSPLADHILELGALKAHELERVPTRKHSIMSHMIL
ncbi:hypothetical protein A0H81_06815 [Grifola frondosa]|uniref:Uncharacterized protein n=1 Tax=Grifola frondosa TaxID=5627 RepID=A0A1C7M8X6_GRIFR|nr:hypothetical protein A0H81_06815 [Grifola frondosa]